HLTPSLPLQDDYHKLLTKYAEAENTIDQLRLGAKVSLYADPPKPSHSVHMGTLGSGSKVMAFSIPQARTAAISTAPAPVLQPSLDAAQGPVSQGTSSQPCSPPFPGMGCPTCPGECRCRVQHPCPGTQLTQMLAGQTHKFQAQVESFEAWVQTGKSTPQEQLQRFRKLKDTQDALERTYLQAREENRRLQQHPGTAGEFDPDRTVEGEIFCLGMRLEELKDRLERAAGSQRSPRSGSGAGSPGTGGSSASSESETGGAQLPQLLWHKRLQVEEDFGDLLEQYQHFKSLPESLSLERLSLGGSQSPEEVDGLVAGERGLGKVSCRTQSPEERRDLPASPRQPPERRVGRLPPEEPAWENDHLPHAGEPLSTTRAAAAPAGLLKPAGLQVPLSPRSSGAGSAVSRHQLRQAKPAPAQVSARRPGATVGPTASPKASRARVSQPVSQLLLSLQEQRIVSPETDSGFVGSEASRVSPLEHQPPRTGTPASLGRSGPISTAVTLHPLQRREAAPLHSEKAPMSTYTACGHGATQDGTRGPGLPPGTSSQTSSPPRWADSVTSEMAPMAPDADGTSPGGTIAVPTWPFTVNSFLPAHTDSAVEERSSASSCSPRPGKTRAPAGLTHPALCPDQTHRDLLGSRMERDRAIRALRDEVSRLQQRLEESLHRSRSYPEGKGPPRRQTVGRGLSPEEPA
ncbi:AKNA factor, partial [Crypturellus soui]|nr:AKNA factor [Crypturellus soui]